MARGGVEGVATGDEGVVGLFAINVHRDGFGGEERTRPGELQTDVGGVCLEEDDAGEVLCELLELDALVLSGGRAELLHKRLDGLGDGAVVKGLAQERVGAGLVGDVGVDFEVE